MYNTHSYVRCTRDLKSCVHTKAIPMEHSDVVYMSVCSSIFHNSQRVKKPKCVSSGQMDNRNIYTEKYHSAIKNNEIPL